MHGNFPLPNRHADEPLVTRNSVKTLAYLLHLVGAPCFQHSASPGKSNGEVAHVAAAPWSWPDILYSVKNGLDKMRTLHKLRMLAASARKSTTTASEGEWKAWGEQEGQADHEDLLRMLLLPTFGENE